MRYLIPIFLIYFLVLVCLVVADTNKKQEISADQYKAVTALVYLRPAILDQAREAFSDGVIDRVEYDALRAAYDALDDKEKPAELKEAKERFQNQLNEQ